MNEKKNFPNPSENLDKIIYRGVPIYRFDFKNMMSDQIIAAITTGTYYIQNSDENNLRMLIITQGIEENGHIQRKFRKTAVEIAHKCQKIAIVSNSQTHKLIGKSINTIVSTSVHTFESEETARDWLAM